MKNEIKVILSTWTDVTSPESVEMGDYERTGEDMRNYDLSGESVESIAKSFIRQMEGMATDSIDRFVGEVIYDTEADIDYKSGEEAFKRLHLDINTNDTIIPIEVKQLRAAVEAEIDRQLSI